MKTIITMFTLGAVLSVLDYSQAERPAVDALLQRAAAFEQWGQRMYRSGDITAAEAALYQARKLEAEAGELRLVESDQRAEPAIQRLSLLVEKLLDDLSAGQAQVVSRLADIELRLAPRVSEQEANLLPDIEALPEGLNVDASDESGETFFNAGPFPNDGSGHPRLGLITDERLGKLSEAHAKVRHRLKELEKQLTQRLESSNGDLGDVVESIVGNVEELAAQARNALDQLRSEIAEFGDRSTARRDGEDEKDDRDEAPPSVDDSTSSDLREEEDHDALRPRKPTDRPRRIHLRAAFDHLNAPPIQDHLHEAIEHLHAAGLHEVAEQLEGAIHAAKQRVQDEMGSGNRPRAYHKGRSHGPRDHAHRRSDERIERLQDEVAALSERLKRLEKTVRKNKKKKKHKPHK